MHDRVNARSWMPWPLKDINLVVEATGADMLAAAGGYMIAFQSPENHTARSPAIEAPTITQRSITDQPSTEIAWEGQKSAASSTPSRRDSSSSAER